MAIQWNSIKVGDVLYESKRTRMGNTTLSRMGTYTVEVMSIDHDKNIAHVKWNGNSRLSIYGRSKMEKLRRSNPKPKGTAK